MASPSSEWIEWESECKSKTQDISFDDPPFSSSLKSVRRKNVQILAQIKENVCILILSETKRDVSFPEEQFKMPGFTTPFEGIEMNFGVEL